MRFARLLENQHGAFTRRQARTAGFSDHRITVRLGTGEWIAVTRSVLIVAGAAPGDRLRDDWVALLSSGEGSIFAGFSAARLHGFDDHSGPSCVLVPPGRNVRVPGARVLREPVIANDVVAVGRASVTSRGRTVVDCLLLLPELPAMDFVDRALQQRWITSDELVRRVQFRLGRHGTPRLVRLVRRVSGGARFEAERRLVTLLRQRGIAGWVCNLALPGAGIIDIAFPEVLLAIEVDGLAWHSDARRFQADRTKQNRLVAAGWTVLRFTWRDLVDRPHHVLATIEAGLDRLARSS